jgi:hypothetical protein
VVCREVAGLRRGGSCGSGGGCFRLRREAERDLLDALGGGCEQALDAHAHQTSEAGIAVAVQLLGVGEGALDRLLAAAIDGLAPLGQPVGVGALAGILPDMAGDQPGRVGA